MSGRRDYLKALTGKNRKELFEQKRRPYSESLDRLFNQSRSRYPLRLLGTGESGRVYISEEEREVNFHILGAPGEGKSRFLEHNIRKDIDMGNGLCLLDPSDFGDTCKKVLAYCASIGHEKVILIDPTLDKIPCIQPLRNTKQSIDGLMEAVGILFNSKETDTPRIRRYLSATLRLLAKRNLTLYESQQFSNYRPLEFDFDRDSQTLKSAFRSPYTWEQFYGSTINRLDMFWEYPLSYILGADEGIDFQQIVRDGWVVLVNLYPYMMTMTQSRLLGVIIINQLIQAIDSLRNDTWKGVYYLYMDEAARFATPQIEEVLTYKRKSGLRLVLAHHDFIQFDNKKVLHAIKNGARVKVMFNTPSYDDRLEMIKDLGYGGDIPPLLASYANSDLPKQQVIIKKNKEAPVRIKVVDVPDIKVDTKDYIAKILENPWYKTKEEIKQQIDARYPRSFKSHTKRAEHRKASDEQAASGSTVPERRKSVPPSQQTTTVSKRKTTLKI